jgi:histidine triad (HIT) family protein
MTLHAPYDPDNIFAKILRGDMPCVQVLDDEVVLAFMDVFPQSEGHTLIIPKHGRTRNLLDFPPEQIASYFARVQRLTQAVEAALQPDGIQVMQFNGSDAGQTVFHLHFHIIPRWSGGALKRHGTGKMASAAELEPIAAKIRAQLVS